MLKGTGLALALVSALLITALGQQQSAPPPPPPQQAPPSTQWPTPAPERRAAPAPTPEAEEDDEVVRITTNLVQVDAVVTDKDGKQVTDLTADDFEITENGRPRKITNFSYIRVQPAGAAPEAARAPARPRGGAAPVPPARLRPSQVQRTIALVVDDLLMSVESTHFTRRALRKYVDEQLQPGDLAAIVRTSAGVGALQQFTNDRQLLYRAIERVRWSPRRSRELGMPDRPSGGAGVFRSGLSQYDEFRTQMFTVGTLGALDFVVRGLREMPGRKAVILFSDGLFLRDLSGEGTGKMSMFDGLIDRANRASVVFYTIDARGLQPAGVTAEDDTAGHPAAPLGAGPGGRVGPNSSTPTHEIGLRLLSARRGEIFEGQGGLHQLARATGGVSMINQNDLGRGVRRALDDMSGYYLIGYRPDDSAFDPAAGGPRFNRLVVAVKNRSGLTVRSRNGYSNAAGGTRQPRPTTRAGQLKVALESPFGSAGVNLRLTSLFIDTPTGGPALRSMLHIDPRTLTFTPQPDGQQQTVMDILAVTFGEDGRVVDELNRIETIRVRPEAFERIQSQGMVYELHVPVKQPGAYQLRIAVRDAATQRVGAANQYVEVPNLSRKRLALSGLIVAVSPEAGGGAAPGNRMLRPASRQFRRGSLLDYGFVVYNARLDRADRRPRLTIQTRLFHEGREVYAGQPQPLDPGQQTDMSRIEAAGRLQLGAELQPGEYVLQVIVTDPLAGESHRVAAQWIDFELAQ